MAPLSMPIYWVGPKRLLHGLRRLWQRKLLPSWNVTCRVDLFISTGLLEIEAPPQGGSRQARHSLVSETCTIPMYDIPTFTFEWIWMTHLDRISRSQLSSSSWPSTKTKDNDQEALVPLCWPLACSGFTLCMSSSIQRAQVILCHHQFNVLRFYFVIIN